MSVLLVLEMEITVKYDISIEEIETYRYEIEVGVKRDFGYDKSILLKCDES